MKKVNFAIDAYAVATSDKTGKRVAVMLDYARQTPALVVAAVHKDRGYDAWSLFEKIGWQIVRIEVTGSVMPTVDSRWVKTNARAKPVRRRRPKKRIKVRIRRR